MDGQDLGFVGLGRMGGPMVVRLLDVGHRLTVYDVDDAAMQRLTSRGAHGVGSPAEVAEAAEIVLTSLPTPEIVEQVALGAGGIAEGSRVKSLIELSTIGPGTAIRVAAGLAERAIQWIEAPVSGGVRGAENGTLAVMVACPQGHVRARPGRSSGPSARSSSWGKSRGSPRSSSSATTFCR